MDSPSERDDVVWSDETDLITELEDTETDESSKEGSLSDFFVQTAFKSELAKKVESYIQRMKCLAEEDPCGEAAQMLPLKAVCDIKPYCPGQPGNNNWKNFCVHDSLQYKPMLEYGLPGVETSETSGYKEAVELLTSIVCRSPYREKSSYFCTQTVVFFMGSRTNGLTSWDNDCHLLEALLKYFFNEYPHIRANLVKIGVGSPRQYRNPDNVFRRDAIFKVTDLPTLWVWGTSKRIQGPDCLSLKNLWTLFNY